MTLADTIERICAGAGLAGDEPHREDAGKCRRRLARLHTEPNARGGRRHRIPAGHSLHNRGWLREHYVTRRMTARRIGEICGASKDTVSRYLDMHGIPRRGACFRRRWSA